VQVVEKIFLDNIEQAKGETLVTMFTAHASWALQMVDQCLVKKT